MNTNALISIWNHTQQHKGTSGARVCAAVLLGLYNGARFPMDMTDLRILDGELLADALEVIAADSRRCVQEVHVWLNYLSGRMDFSERFEALAHEYKTFAKGKCGKRGDYAHVARLVIEERTSKTIEAARANWEDAFNAEIKRAAPLMTDPVGLAVNARVVAAFEKGNNAIRDLGNTLHQLDTLPNLFQQRNHAE